MLKERTGIFVLTKSVYVHPTEGLGIIISMLNICIRVFVIFRSISTIPVVVKKAVENQSKPINGPRAHFFLEIV